MALAGEGTVDYRNLLGYGDNLLPPLMVQSAGGLFPSDNRLGDVNGDGLPEMAVGHIPVLSAAELDAYTAKIAAYESAARADWAANLVMLADAPDQGADFSADSERIAGQIPASFRALGGDPTLPPLYSLLGDPALRVPVPVAATPAPGGSGE